MNRRLAAQLGLPVLALLLPLLFILQAPLVSAVPPAVPTTPLAASGQLHVCGVKLCNDQNQPVQLRGMSTHGIQWFDDCVNDAAMDALADDWGADVMRISMYIQDGGYETDPVRFTNRVSQIIDEVTARGMYAIVDWHMLSPGDPHHNLARAKTFFTEIGRRHNGNTNLLYEIANEPSGVSWSRVKSYAEQLIPVIRRVDPETPILVGTRAWSSLGISDGANETEVINNPVNAQNIMYTFHFYAASHREEYLNALSRAANRIPIFVSEFGTQDYAGEGPNDFAMAQRYIDLMNSKGISWTNWNYSDDHRSGAVFKPGTCPNGPFAGTSNLKEAGVWVRARIRAGGPVDPPVGLISRGRPTTSSSNENASLSPGNAVDGNSSTRWASAEGSDPQWIRVDLGAGATVSRVLLRWEAAYARAYRIEMSVDGSTWTKLASEPSGDGGVDEWNGLRGEGRYLRVYGTARGTPWGYSLWELEVYGTAGSSGRETVDVSTAAELRAALADASPGQTIRLAPGTYRGSFVARRAGTESAPITLSGPRDAVLINDGPSGSGPSCPVPTSGWDSGYGLWLFDASHWRLTGFTVAESKKGVVLDGSRHVVIDSVRVHHVDEEAVHFRRSSADGVLKNSRIEHTGLVQKRYGEGVYIGSANSNWGCHGNSDGVDRSDRVRVLDNRIGPYVSAEHIDIKEGTREGLVQGNTFDGRGITGEHYADSWVDAKGDSYLVAGNTGTFGPPGVFAHGYETHNPLGYGCGNVWRDNVSDLGGVGGYAVYVTSRSKCSANPNVVRSSNTVSNAREGLTNIPVTP